jgi:hypothetical protein
MTLSRMGRFVALLAAVGDGIDVTVDCPDRNFLASVGIVHLLLAILTDGHGIHILSE